jgi:hypothetical protein
MEAHPDLESGIAEAGDTPNQLDRRVAGERRMIVVCDRRTEYGGKAVAEFLADDTAELAHRSAHRDQCGLEAGDGGLRIEFGNETRGINHVGTQNRDETPLAVRLCPPQGGAASGAPAIAWVNRRLACGALHFRTFRIPDTAQR